MSYSDLKGKTFIVTGAASGMGRTTCLALAKQGANVGLLDLRKPDNVLSEIEKLGGEAISLACNVQDRYAVDEAVKAVVDRFGGLHGAANMAGYVGNQGFHGKDNALDIMDDAYWDNMLTTNLNGVKNCLRAQFNHIKEGGSIVNAASIAGQMGVAYNSCYAASKWGVIGLSKSAAQEGGARGIRVNAVAPGVVDTPLVDSLGSEKEVYDFLLSKTALKRIAQPEEVSKVIMFLFSEEAGYVTGNVGHILNNVRQWCC
ncbi:hypothetical protein Z517_03716 [Fonsecaea pedrosoi CBS 271.37]|uniref:3-oxoacyl-[acyl-carrier-protein] reductase n=1 Tax=Fonsecaea pedrosoi CBS 271.37 TaxID=1442368 RepID=A0A0D2E377_9EURO|nr:uncharacterized protein Z517_03716 [Fonsecaea pedrosoi CBS 271.37]KIW84466.1 hypothetical protein Z517_03716 [Fonsecaea pedrosoi CBS 271.37]